MRPNAVRLALGAPSTEQLDSALRTLAGLLSGEEDSIRRVILSVIASEAKQSSYRARKMDCFVASLLAMTEEAKPIAHPRRAPAIPR